MPEIEVLIDKLKLGLDHYEGFYEVVYGPDLHSLKNTEEKS